jgi:hypothetical protein
MSKPVVINLHSPDQLFQLLNKVNTGSALLRNVPCENCDRYGDCRYIEGRRVCTICELTEKAASLGLTDDRECP